MGQGIADGRGSAIAGKSNGPSRSASPVSPVLLSARRLCVDFTGAEGLGRNAGPQSLDGHDRRISDGGGNMENSQNDGETQRRIASSDPADVLRPDEASR